MGSSPIFLGQDLIVLIEWSDHIRSNRKLKDWKKKLKIKNRSKLEGVNFKSKIYTQFLNTLSSLILF